MKKTKLSLLFFVILLGAMPIKAQKQFFFASSANTGNEWGDLVLQLPFLITNAVKTGEFNIPFPAVPLRFGNIKQNGEKLDYDGKHVFGFKGVDLFRDVDVSVKFGWQPVRTPVAVYAQFGFAHENFDTRLNENDKWLKHRLNRIRPGLGIRLSPFDNLVKEIGFCPIAEIGSTYDYCIGYKNGIDTDKEALNNGISFNVSVGVKGGNGSALMLTFEKENYDLFNNDYMRHGNKPFDGMTTNRYRIYLCGSYAF
ncbi:MAG: hypothetical protein IJ551_11475 [Prevotella sp.]|nr:hypothetical protein [Prevotella sp.]MBQ8713419.1 hypothetical protein [Prevotella sp.]